MMRQTLGKILVSVALVLSAVISTVVDLLPGEVAHVQNPEWHPHAIFHDIVMFLLLDFMAIVCLWLLWRKSTEPRVGVTVSVLLVAGFWTPFYYITTLFPQASLSASPHDVSQGAILVSWMPFPLYINVLVGTVLLAVAVIGYYFYRKGE